MLTLSTRSTAAGLVRRFELLSKSVRCGTLLSRAIYRMKVKLIPELNGRVASTFQGRAVIYDLLQQSSESDHFSVLSIAEMIRPRVVVSAIAKEQYSGNLGRSVSFCSNC
ncbi:hypothetical protein CEXT_45481 [Caerostris extrusa]|uniref:Uncharacterized protein n=1 Tax=Caerostris extrusa TaxID=172846 RepID=A0AAV4QPX9_CAEEX|nr:hypothetical protein CEXT_45481 [Caerostris extrusa]